MDLEVPRSSRGGGTIVKSKTYGSIAIPDFARIFVPDNNRITAARDPAGRWRPSFAPPGPSADPPLQLWRVIFCINSSRLILPAAKSAAADRTMA